MNETLLSFTTSLRNLRALNRLASTDETRWVLNGIRVDAAPNRLILVATNGRALGAYHHGKEFEYSAELPPPFTIPRALIESACKAWPDGITQAEDEMGREFNTETHPPDVTVEYHADKTVTIAGPDMTLKGMALDGKYPDWRIVLPSVGQAPKHANLNPMYLGVFADVARDFQGALGNGCICLRGYASDDNRAPFSVHFPRVPFVGLLMPMAMDDAKNPEGYDTIPTWLK